MKHLKNDLKTISDMANQEILFEHDGFVIRKFDDDTYWFENPDGEGTQLGKEMVTEALNQLFNAVF